MLSRASGKLDDLLHGKKFDQRHLSPARRALMPSMAAKPQRLCPSSKRSKTESWLAERGGADWDQSHVPKSVSLIPLS